MAEVAVTAVDPGEIVLAPAERSAAGPGDVAGSTVASVISPGTELAVAFHEGRYPRPLALGYAAVFRIEQAGSDASGPSVGDLVLALGGHSSWQRHGADRVVALPAGCDPLIAPFARLLHIPMAALAASAMRPGTRVGVHGLGVVGQLAARAALASGFDVVGVDADERRRALLPGGVEARDAFGDGSVDLVLECSGHESGALTGARALRSGGELSLVGVPWRPRERVELFPLTDLVFHRHLTVRSGWEWHLPWDRERPRDTMSSALVLSRALTWLRDGTVDVAGLATVIPARDALAAYTALRDRRAPTPTYVLDWR